MIYISKTLYRESCAITNIGWKVSSMLSYNCIETDLPAIKSNEIFKYP